jgi:ABC-type glycerol-3-phosphate transport system substrate-binding protein
VIDGSVIRPHRWVNDLDSQVGTWTTLRGGLPVTRQSWSDRRVVQSDNLPIKNIKPFLDPFERGYEAVHEINPIWSEWIAPFNREFAAAMRGEKPMKVALETAQQEQQVILNQNLPRR